MGTSPAQLKESRPYKPIKFTKSPVLTKNFMYYTLNIRNIIINSMMRISITNKSVKTNIGLFEKLLLIFNIEC